VSTPKRDRTSRTGGRRRHRSAWAPACVSPESSGPARHRRRAALGAELVGARVATSTDHCRRPAFAITATNREERALARLVVMIGSLSSRTRESAVQDWRGRRQALQGYSRLGERLNKGEYKPRRRQAHPRAAQGPPGRHACCECRNVQSSISYAGGTSASHPKVQLRDPGRRQRWRRHLWMYGDRVAGTPNYKSVHDCDRAPPIVRTRRHRSPWGFPCGSISGM